MSTFLLIIRSPRLKLSPLQSLEFLLKDKDLVGLMRTNSILYNLEYHHIKMTGNYTISKLKNPIPKITSIIWDINGKVEDYISKNPDLISLYIYKKWIKDIGIFSSFTNLSLQYMHLDDLDIIDLAQNLGSLVTINLKGNNISDITSLANALKNNKNLINLSLDTNYIANIDLLAQNLQTNTTLKYINLNKNKIKNIDCLAETLLINKTLVKISLASNKISNIDVLADSLVKNNTLKSFNLNSNFITFVDCLIGKNINTYIDLGGNFSDGFPRQISYSTRGILFDQLGPDKINFHGKQIISTH